jgi:nucleotide-binding universal stress UspA family protein
VLKIFTKILIPLDGSKLSEHALKHLDAIAVDSHTRIIVLRVTEPVTALIAGGSDALDMAAIADKEAKVDAQAYLDKIASGLQKKGFHVDTMVTNGDPADDILDYAEKNKVDLIIMSTHGRSGISRLFYGSDAEKVIRHATVPVLISPPHGARRRR